jgi:hypothetical protein
MPPHTLQASAVAPHIWGKPFISLAFEKFEKLVNEQHLAAKPISMPWLLSSNNCISFILQSEENCRK